MANWGSLGEHVFGLGAGPSDEAWKTGAELAAHARIGAKPTQQLTGQKLQEYELTITLHRHTYDDVDAALAALRASCDEGEILDLVIGDRPDTGAWAGQWLIADLDGGSITRAPGGSLYSIEVKIKLREWVKRDGLEVSKRKPPAVRPKTQTKKTEPTGPGYQGGMT